MTKILVADDNQSTRKLLCVTLEKNGYEVVAAEDGITAWDILKSRSDIRLAVVDWMMPGMDGIELCRKLQEEHKSELIYVILLTAKEGTKNLIEALEAGANDYISKPFEKEELLARLRSGERIIKLQQQLTQLQKLESIGQLASGIAHEINTPIQYIGDNINFLQESFQDIYRLLGAYEQVREQAEKGTVGAELLSKIQDTMKEVDIEYLSEEVPRALKDSLKGVNVVARIVQAMKEFAHHGKQEKTAADINQTIESTITVTRGRWKYVAEMETDFDPELPLVICRIDEFNQVIPNLIVNAIDAIKEKNGEVPEVKGTITISTRRDGDWVEIRVADTGSGIPEKIHARILDPFFTTKEVGKGSGQGLAISYAVVVDKHGGTLTFETEVGKGTTFIVRLPIEQDVSSGDVQDEEAYCNC
ncbi:MAG: response regulator [Sedimentisphaerales bacterium]|nr:response regulator [Sedimentisphaerales bacterium]